MIVKLHSVLNNSDGASISTNKRTAEAATKFSRHIDTDRRQHFHYHVLKSRSILHTELHNCKKNFFSQSITEISF